MEQKTCKDRLLKTLGLFAVERRRLRGDAIKIYNIPKEEGKVKIELVFTRAHSNKMGKSMHFFTQRGVNFCNLSALEGAETDCFSGLKKGQGNSRTGGP